MNTTLALLLVLAAGGGKKGKANEIDVTIDDTSVTKNEPAAPAPVSAADAEVTKAAPSETTSGQSWSAIGGKTLPPGANTLTAEVGYPGISGAYLRGVAPGINIGARVGFVYGVEGLFREGGPGLKVQGLLKVRFVDAGQISLAVGFEPGFFVIGSYLQGSRSGLALPIGFRLGIAASSAIAIGVHVDFPMWIEFGQFGGFNLPILTGGGAEYFITSELTVFARARIGPTIRTLRPAEVTFDAALGVSWRF
ncbi:MAG: hypothetical protein JNM17_00990 [Archangium sp.]|nr:hypothetical protein [Archangium sp.]